MYGYRGTVVAVVPAGKSIGVFLRESREITGVSYRCDQIGRSTARDHDSYLVLDDRKYGRQAILRWPKVELLERVSV